ncbi:FlgN family protein [Caldanaerobacter subterraneus subsp. yonseiensis KB-1]|uniref:FlgN family protein n=1 Tax=Caldanaerobacter subterraneus subsp. yonseiensis KB-1 TaxID=1388761 RepID=U5CFR4_CALSX|nr:flagellar protein FlgN [Caldanaerobacter subterraneus]ERM91775.1 FlgN family protein [Caldanaerobacter subterraneus subsp. yonseiensis KB-1]
MNASQRLLGLLKEEMAIYEILLELATKKTDIIIHGKIKELDETVQMERNFIKKLVELEEKRENTLKEMGKGEGVTISEVIKNLPLEEAVQFNNVKERLSAVLKELEQRNDLNMALIEQALEYVNYSIKAISEALEEDKGIYGEKGSSKGYTSLIDKKA